MSSEAESSSATKPSLLGRLKDWSQQTAWREFDRDYAPLLRNVARKAGLTDAEADEVAQEVMIAVAKKIGDFRHAGHPGSFRAWLYQQARWRIADQFRAREGSERISEEAPAGDGPHDLNQSIDSDFEQLWEREWVDYVHRIALGRVRNRVSSRQFQLFDLHVLQGLSVREAASAAGASVAAVYMAKSRVGRALKREIKALITTELHRTSKVEPR